jgi:hypothetical protein
MEVAILAAWTFLFGIWALLSLAGIAFFWPLWIGTYYRLVGRS